MFGFGFSRKLREENAQLQEQILQLKAAAPPEFVSGSTGAWTNFLHSQPNFGNIREQLAHFRNWQFVAIRAIATRVAGQKVFVGRTTPPAESQPRTTKSADDGDGIQPIQSHAILTAINDPNPIMVRWSLMFSTVAALELTGRSYWWFRRGADERLQIWPLPPDWVTPIHDRGLYANWKLRPRGSTKEYILNGDDLAYFYLPDPGNPIDGAVSPLQSQATAINCDEAIQSSQIQAFRNGVNPSVILRVGRQLGPDGRPMDKRHTLTPEQRSQLINAVKLAWGGVVKRGEAAIVDGLIEGIDKFSNSPSEMDFLNSGKQTKSRILQAYGVNPLIVGEIEGSNRAQAVVAEESFAKNVVNPLLQLLGEILTAWLSPKFGEDLVVWFDKVRAHDDELESRYWWLLFSKGGCTVNEYRQRFNLPPIPWGDVPIEGPGKPQAAAAAIDATGQPMKHLNGNGRLVLPLR